MYPLLITLIPLLPILGFAFTALFGRRLQARFGRGAAEIVPVGRDRPSGSSRWRSSCPALTHAEPFGEHGLDVQALDLDPGRQLHRSTSGSTSTR